jgi:hypothetical protein
MAVNFLCPPLVVRQNQVYFPAYKQRPNLRRVWIVKHHVGNSQLLGPLVAADAAEKEDGEDKDRGNDRAGGPFDDIDDNCVREQ